MAVNMLSETVIMDEDPECIPECGFCAESISDPRALPCGHSFCGPPRPCVSGLEKRSGVLKCSLCRAEHKMNKESLKPLFGIRDVLQAMEKAADRRKSVSRVQLPKCPKHSEMVQMFWCLDCKQGTCEDCCEEEHADHSMFPYKSFLKREVEKKVDMLDKVESLLPSAQKKLDELKAYHDLKGALKEFSRTGTTNLSFAAIESFVSCDLNLLNDNVERSLSVQDFKNQIEDQKKALKRKHDEIETLEKQCKHETVERGKTKQVLSRLNSKFAEFRKKSLSETIKQNSEVSALKAELQKIPRKILLGDIFMFRKPIYKFNEWFDCSNLERTVNLFSNKRQYGDYLYSLQCQFVSEGRTVGFYLHSAPIEEKRHVSEVWPQYIAFHLDLWNTNGFAKLVCQAFSRFDVYGSGCPACIELSELLDKSKGWIHANNKVRLECSIFKTEPFF